MAEFVTTALLDLLDAIKQGFEADDPHGALDNIASHALDFVEHQYDRRLVACANACEGLATEALESAGDRPVLALLNAASETTAYDEQRDEGGGPLYDAVRALWEVPGG